MPRRPGRSVKGPIVSFQIQRYGGLLPSRLLPPGKRRKEGLRSLSACIRSILRPFGRSLYVGGNREMRLKFRDPLTAPPSNVIEKVLLTSEAASVGVNVKLCCVHFPGAN